jgi:DNA-binding CsgD family transcriptional regulator
MCLMSWKGITAFCALCIQYWMVLVSADHHGKHRRRLSATMTSFEPEFVYGRLDSGHVDFFVDMPSQDRLAVVEAALHRLGCQTESQALRLHVWLPAHPAFELLSARELQLVCLASKGNTDKEIARQVGLSIYTVRSYWVRICHKLAAHNRTHAVSIVFANEAAIPQPPLSA